MTIKVLEHPLSPYAQKVKLALLFKDIPFDVEMPMIGAADAFTSISPRGEVPVLSHDEVSLYDSSVIVAYVDETWPEPPLLPSSPIARAHIRLIEAAMDTHFEGNTWGLGEIQVFGRASGDLANHMIRAAESEIRRWFAWLEPRLSKDGWFNGESYGLGDMAVVPFINGAARFDIRPASGTPLDQWLVRVNDRADVQAVTTAATAAELDPDVMRAAIAAGFKREYRDHRLEWMIRSGGLDVVADGIAADNIRFNGSFSEST